MSRRDKKIIYLTFNDTISGIYKSQVTDVCSFISKETNNDVQLIAFISIRKFRKNRKDIKQNYSDAVVLPMFPGVANWRKNYLMLLLFMFFPKFDKIIARGPFAAALALRMRTNKRANRVCFDARGAYTAEFNEYDVSGNKKLREQIGTLENEVLNNSDERIAVSEHLVDYWKKNFGYTKQEHVVIPCTLSKEFETGYDLVLAEKMRKELGVTADEVLLVYSGSNAKWQSLDKVAHLLLKQMQNNKNIKVLMLARTNEFNTNLLKGFENRIIQKWVAPNEVRALLMACDHGLLIREPSVTNQVASPVKFAEYLSCGLKILISEGIGDYSSLVKTNDLGICIKDDADQIELKRPDAKEKMRMNTFAIQTFSKKMYLNSYLKILND